MVPCTVALFSEAAAAAAVGGRCDVQEVLRHGPASVTASADVMLRGLTDGANDETH